MKVLVTNPAALVLVLALAMALTPAWRDFAVTAPNVAHLLFFSLGMLWLSSGSDLRRSP